MTDFGQEMLTFVEGDPEYYKSIESFLHVLSGRIEDIQSVFDDQALKEFAVRLTSQCQDDAFVPSDHVGAEQEVRAIFRELDSMLQMCLVTQTSTDCQPEAD